MRLMREYKEFLPLMGKKESRSCEGVSDLVSERNESNSWPSVADNTVVKEPPLSHMRLKLKHRKSLSLTRERLGEGS
jgi:hypothetical protein